MAYIDPVRRQSTTFSLLREPRTARFWFRTTTGTQVEGRLVWVPGGRVLPDRRARESFRNHHRVVPLVVNPADVKRILPNPPDRRSCRDGSSSFREPGRITRSRQCRRNARTSARCRTHAQEGQRIRPESRRVRVARQPHAGRGEPVRLRRRAPQPGPVPRSRTPSRGSCAGRRRARREIEPDSVTLTLVNTSPSAPRRLIVQMGAYGEHQAISVRSGDRVIPVRAPHFEIRSSPGG